MRNKNKVAYENSRNHHVKRNPRSLNENAIRNYNPFDPLVDQVECKNFYVYGYKAQDCRNNLHRPLNQDMEEGMFKHKQ